jgi:hypothetical protein
MARQRQPWIWVDATGQGDFEPLASPLLKRSTPVPSRNRRLVLMDLIVVGALLFGLAAVGQWTLAPSLPAADTMIYEFSSSDESLQALPLAPYTAIDQ